MEKETNLFTSLKKFSTGNFDVVIVSKGNFRKYYINSNLLNGRNPLDTFKSINEFLINEHAQIVTQDIFGSCSLYLECIRSLKEIFYPFNWPVTWIEGNSSGETKITGTQIYAIAGVSVNPIIMDEQISGNFFVHENVQICMLSGILPTNLNSTNEVQSEEVFNKIEHALKIAGMDYSNIVRTWFYVNNILEWYQDFNKVRTNFFNARGVFNGILPASTGIGVGNPQGAALVAEVLAIKSDSGNVLIKNVNSPLQCPAPDYQSSFSRAVEVKFSDYRRLYISGTASIDSVGNSLHPGDLANQISRTMEVVGAILESRNMSWNDTSRAIAYFPNLAETYLLENYCKNKSIPPLPLAIAKGDICRDDLLFEIEIDAVSLL